MRFGNVKEVLKRNNVPFDEEELDTRLTLLVDVLRGNYDQSKVDEFVREPPKRGGYVELPKVQYGGIRRMLGGAEPMENPFKSTEPAEPIKNPFKPEETNPEKPKKEEPKPPKFMPDSDDFLSPWMRWFIDMLSSPFARTGLKILFMVIFFVAYLERLPMVGGILGAALDLTVGAAKAGTKLIQQGVFTLFGVIPFGGPIGIMLATIFGWFAWGLLGALSFSRTDFAEALSSSFRTIVYPLGNILGDIFDATNRVAGKIQMQAGRIWSNIKDILRYIGGFNKTTAEGVEKITNKLEEARPEFKMMDKARDLVDTARDKVKSGELAEKAVSTAATGVVAAKGLKRSFDQQVAEQSTAPPEATTAPPEATTAPPEATTAPPELLAKAQETGLPLTTTIRPPGPRPPNTFRAGRKSKNKWKTLHNRSVKTFVSS